MRAERRIENKPEKRNAGIPEQVTGGKSRRERKAYIDPGRIRRS